MQRRHLLNLARLESPSPLPAGIHCSAQPRTRSSSAARYLMSGRSRPTVRDLGMKLAIEQYGRQLGRRWPIRCWTPRASRAGTAVRKVQESAQQQGARFFAGGIRRPRTLAVARRPRRPAACSSPAGRRAIEITARTATGAVVFRWSVPPRCHRADRVSTGRGHAEGQALVHDHAAICVGDGLLAGSQEHLLWKRA